MGSAYHAELLRESIPQDMVWYGALPRDAEAALPERHLGLLQAAEIGDLETRLDRLADALQGSLVEGAKLPPAVEFARPATTPISTLLNGKAIAIARDAAFGFIYPANIDTLITLGASLRFFSPLAGDVLPECDAVWLPGGYPELHAATLAARIDLWAALHAHVDAGKPVLAECGGMMALFETLIDRDDSHHQLGGLLPGTTAMQPRLTALGTQFAELPEGRLSGHTFHYSKSETSLVPLVRAVKQAAKTGNDDGEAIYRIKRLTSSYVHFYFPSNPQAIAAIFS